LRQALSDYAGSPAAAEELLKSAGIDPSKRGEQLDIHDFVKIASA
jgi:16S rRNA (adenine1518-N6/adenine1519-N6)-dimethyltransferase